jgi:tRNA threonylcarbamoyladenosine biosynthesis protein TsaE
VHLESEADTLALGARLAHEIAVGDILGISGELGAGKTTLVRGLLRGLGFRGEVLSPTFNLIQEYETYPPICHVDLYRLENINEIAELGLTDYLPTHALLIEWIERSGSYFKPTRTISLFIEGDGRRAQVS